MKSKQIATATLILLFADFLWIYLFMASKYKVQVRLIQNSELQVKPYFIVVAYTLMVLGLILFVLPNIKKEYPFQSSLYYGFTFGVILYGVYDFTAASVFNNWDVKLALIDVLWGGIVYFIASYFSHFMIQ